MDVGLIQRVFSTFMDRSRLSLGSLAMHAFFDFSKSINDYLPIVLALRWHTFEWQMIFSGDLVQERTSRIRLNRIPAHLEDGGQSIR